MSQTDPKTIKKILKMKKTMSSNKIAEELNVQGITTVGGTEWTGPNVAYFVKAYKNRSAIVTHETPAGPVVTGTPMPKVGSLKKVLKQLGMNNKQFAEALTVHVSNLARWKVSGIPKNHHAKISVLLSGTAVSVEDAPATKRAYKKKKNIPVLKEVTPEEIDLTQEVGTDGVVILFTKNIETAIMLTNRLL